MTSEEKSAFKTSLKAYCEEQLTQRMNTIREKIEHAQQSANQEEKSSAGDKYETSRAMNHLEKDMHSRQLAENTKELALLHAVNARYLYTQVTSGAFVQCGDTAFFIAAGLGKKMIDGQTIFFLSPEAPIAKALLNKKEGDSFLFNKITLQIQELF